MAVPKEYNAATGRYSGEARLGSNGDLFNYVAGLPFPDVHPTDPQVGLKMGWNFYWRWTGDDYRTGGGTGKGKIIRYAIEKDGSERRADVLHHVIKTRGRVTLDSKPWIDGYEHIDWMQLRADEYPRDTAGTTTLEIRYADPKREDDLTFMFPVYAVSAALRRFKDARPSPLVNSILMTLTVLAGRLPILTIVSWDGQKC